MVSVDPSLPIGPDAPLQLNVSAQPFGDVFVPTTPTPVWVIVHVVAAGANMPMADPRKETIVMFCGEAEM